MDFDSDASQFAVATINGAPAKGIYSHHGTRSGGEDDAQKDVICRE